MTTTRTITALSLLLFVAGCPSESSSTDEGRDGQAMDDGTGDAGADGDGDASDGDHDPTVDDGGTDDPRPVPRAAARFFLPTDEPNNTAAPAVEVDAGGGIHAVYPAYAGGDAYYAYCAQGCDDESDVKVVHFTTEATVVNAMLALDGDKPRVLLSTFDKVYFASCDEDCTRDTSWSFGEILDHAGDRDVSGAALALDPSGRPRFVMHTYLALFGIGQKPAATWYARCDAACTEAASWRYDVIQDQIWQSSSLRFDTAGRAHLATVAVDLGSGGPTSKSAAYLVCDDGCVTADDWSGIGLYPPYESMTAAVSIPPTVSLALTREGAPRVLVLGKDEAGGPNIVYFECDQGCDQDRWRGSIISNHASLGAGLDLALDNQDRPRLVYTLDYNIALAYCDSKDCTADDAPWELTKVELSSDMEPDTIFLWPNCNVGAWFLHSPSLALTADGAPRVGYQARDISGGWSNPDPTRPDCEAGTDMTWSRLTSLPSYRE